MSDLLPSTCHCNIVTVMAAEFGMHWVRSNRYFGSWAALFALAIQLVLSFGHIHFEDIQGSSAIVAAQSQAQPNAPADDDNDRGFRPASFLRNLRGAQPDSLFGSAGR